MSSKSLVTVDLRAAADGTNLPPPETALLVLGRVREVTGGSEFGLHLEGGMLEPFIKKLPPPDA